MGSSGRMSEAERLYDGPTIHATGFVVTRQTMRHRPPRQRGALQATVLTWTTFGFSCCCQGRAFVSERIGLFQEILVTSDIGRDLARVNVQHLRRELPDEMYIVGNEN